MFVTSDFQSIVLPFWWAFGRFGKDIHHIIKGILRQKLSFPGTIFQVTFPNIIKRVNADDIKQYYP